MNRWFRNLAAAAVVAVGINAPARAAEIDPLVPKDATSIVKLNIKQILESDIIKKYALANIKQAMESGEAQKKLKELGLDPLKDIDTLNGGFWGEDAQNMHGLFILRGKFDPAKLFEAIEKAVEKSGDKLSIIKEGDVKLVKMVVDKLPEPLFATMANDKTILVGTDKKIVLDGLKASDAKVEKSEVKKELADLVEKMDKKASMYVVGLSDPSKIPDLPPQLGQVIDDLDLLKKNLKAMESSAMMLRVTGDVALEIHMYMKDGDSAKSFGEQVEDLLGKARVFLPLIASQAPQAKPVADDVKKSLKSEVDSKTIKLTVKLTGDAIGKAAGVDE